MRTFIKNLLASVIVGFYALSVQAQPGIKHTTATFINGCNIYMPTNITYQYGYTNILFDNLQGAPVFSLSNNAVYYTNAVGVTSNVFTYPPAIVDVSSWCDANGGVLANAAITIGINATNLFLQGLSIPNPNNPNSVTGSNPTATTTNIGWGQMVLPVATSTNILTFTFQKGVDGGGYPSQQGIPAPSIYDTTIADQFVVVVTNTSGLIPVVICTNLPSNFLTGAKSIRLVSVVSSAAFGTSTGDWINFVKLGGWSP